jgi:hypothetical protein
MTAIVEVKINTPEDMITFGNAIKEFDIDHLNVSSSYGYSTVSYQCTKKELLKIREFWRNTFDGCRVVSY